MKKISIILLLCIYSMATMGFSINQFYCCGKLSSTSLTLIEKTKQNCEKSGCCENKSHFIKVRDNHFSSNEVNSPLKQFTEFHSFFPYFDDITCYRQTLITIADRSNAPPLFASVPSYILNCVFRI
jgi:hypothetical protein